MLCAKPPPHTIQVCCYISPCLCQRHHYYHFYDFFSLQDIEDRVSKTFPTPIDKWALTEARATIDKSRKRKVVLPLNQIQNLLQKVILPLFIYLLFVGSKIIFGAQIFHRNSYFVGKIMQLCLICLIDH